MSEKLVTVKINDEEIKAKEGELLIKLLKKEHMEVPYFCYHDALGADGNCRMCMVEIEGKKRPQIACDTPVKEGMVVKTNSDMIKKVRKNILELELINHPIDCPVCDQAGECRLQDYYMDYGVYEGRIDKAKKVHLQKHLDIGNNVILDQERCVLCQRCVRFTDNITKTHELGVIGRGNHSRISTMPGKKLNNPYAMNIVDLCPVGALTNKDFRFKQRVWFLKSTPAICHGCAKGCNIYIDHNKEKYKDDTIYRIRARVNHDINGYFICDEGRMSYKELGINRQYNALLNSKTIDFGDVSKEFEKIIKETKGDILILADANLYLEELEAIKEFAKTLNAAVCSPLKIYIDESFGDDWLKSKNRAANAKGIQKLNIPQTYEDIEKLELVINFNHPAFKNFLTPKSISFQTHKEFEADLILPIAAFSETEGTLINEDNITQFSQRAIHSKQKIPNIIEWIEMLKDKK